MLHQLRKFLIVSVAPVLLVFSTPGMAISYDVELIIFENVTNSSVGSSPTHLYPVIDRVRRIPVAADPNAPLQPLPELRLTDDAQKIRQSGNHRLLYHGGWRQTDFDQESAPFMSIALGQRQELYVETGEPDNEYARAYRQPPLRSDQSTAFSQTTNLNQNLNRNNTYTLFGGVKVWVGRFLHFDTKLVYTPANSNASFKFESERRMRSRQLHYIDHSRVGILIKVFPVDETAPN